MVPSPSFPYICELKVSLLGLGCYNNAQQDSGPGQQKCIVSEFCSLKVKHQGMGRAMILHEILGKGASCLLPTSVDPGNTWTYESLTPNFSWCSRSFLWCLLSKIPFLYHKDVVPLNKKTLQNDLKFDIIASARLYFRIQYHSEVLRPHLLRGHIPGPLKPGLGRESGF